MIVNGVHQFGGYRRDQARRFIDQEMAKAAGLPLEISVTHHNGTSEVRVKLEEPYARTQINAALVESGLGNQVKSGENAGRSLRHAHVVRDFQSVPVSVREHVLTLRYPPGSIKENCRVIVYLQDQDTYSVKAAGQIGLTL
jgi:hypothetical protein